ncbi:MAG: hypothetical protein WHX60_06055 [Armatimonadota bacterium]
MGISLVHDFRMGPQQSAQTPDIVLLYHVKHIGRIVLTSHYA